MTKECKECHRVLSWSDFYILKGKKSDGGTISRCKECVCRQARSAPSHIKAKRYACTKRWRLRNPESFERTNKASRMIRFYGIGEEEFLARHKAQDGVCEICRKQCSLGPEHGMNGHCTLVVDHCHASGQVRGLLCKTCNAGIGYLKDDPQLVRIAADYLERHGIRLVKENA